MVKDWIVSTSLSEKLPFYTRANIGEVFPDPVAPLTFSFGFQSENGLGGSEIGFREAYYRIGVMTPDEMPDDECVFLGVTGGYAYLNASALRMLGARGPGMSAQDIDDSFFGDAPGIPPIVDEPWHDRPELTAKIGETFEWTLTTPNLPDVLADETMVNNLRANRPDPSSMSDREILDTAWAPMEEHFAHLFGQHIFISFLATLPIGIITKVCAAVGEPESTLKLLAGLGDVESAAPSMMMWTLGRQVAASPTLTALFDAGNAGLDGRIRAAEGDDVTAFVAELDDFTLRYGARGPNEWEARSPTWETDPDLALAAIDRMRLSPESAAPQDSNDERAEERKQIGDRIAAMLVGDPETQGQFMAALNSATVFMPGRERTKTNCIKLIHELRMMMREWGRRCVAAGTMPAVESFGMMEKSEQYAFLDNPSQFQDAIRERRAHYAEVSELQEPFLFVGAPPPIGEYPRRDEVVIDLAALGEVLPGVSGCPGIERGIARVVTDSHDPTALEPGDILVAPITDPSWTPLFVPAAAVVVDVGAPLSHAIIVSRELGIPCVVSCTDATKRIQDGSLIEVNGDTGEVTVISLP